MDSIWFHKALAESIAEGFPAEMRPYMYLRLVPRKETVEIYTYVLIEGKWFRCDAEAAMQGELSAEPGDWGKAETDYIVKVAKVILDGSLNDAKWRENYGLSKVG